MDIIRLQALHLIGMTEPEANQLCQQNEVHFTLSAETRISYVRVIEADGIRLAVEKGYHPRRLNVKTMAQRISHVCYPG